MNSDEGEYSGCIHRVVTNAKGEHCPGGLAAHINTGPRTLAQRQIDGVWTRGVNPRPFALKFALTCLGTLPSFAANSPSLVSDEQLDNPVQLTLRMRLRPAASFDNFVVGANGAALQAAHDLLNSPVRAGLPGAGGAAWAVCFLGPSGCGKTHLLEALCRAATEASLRCAYVPLASGDMNPRALAGLGHLDLVCVDDVDAVVRDPQWQRVLFDLYNQLEDSGGRLAFASHRPPVQLPTGLPDLHSRLCAALALSLTALDDQGRQIALKLHARGRGLDVSDEVSAYVVNRIRQDMPSMMAVLDRLDEAAMVARKRLSLPLVREVLAASRDPATAG